MTNIQRILTGALLVWASLLMGGADAQDVPPPTVDQAGTEASWDITHPGWRQWKDRSDQSVTSSNSNQSNQAELLAIKKKQAEQQKQLEEARKQQQEEEKRRRELEQYWQQVQAQQRQQQAQQQQQQAERQRLFEQAKQALLLNFRVPPVTSVHPARSLTEADSPVTWSPYGTASFGRESNVLSQSQTGLSPQQWQQVRQYQGLIETLRQTADLSPQDDAILAQVEARRNALWARTVSVPGLSDDAREALALSLPVTQANGSVPRMTREALQRMETTARDLKEASPKSVMTLLDCINDVANDNLPESAVVASAVRQFGNLLSLTKITMAAAEGGASSAIAESVDFAIGTLPFPQAKVAVDGGRLYANVAFRATDRFMTDAMQAMGGAFDSEAFWQDFKNNLTVGQRAAMEFIEYGPKK